MEELKVNINKLPRELIDEIGEYLDINLILDLDLVSYYIIEKKITEEYIRLNHEISNICDIYNGYYEKHYRTYKLFNYWVYSFILRLDKINRKYNDYLSCQMKEEFKKLYNTKTTYLLNFFNLYQLEKCQDTKIKVLLKTGAIEKLLKKKKIINKLN